MAKKTKAKTKVKIVWKIREVSEDGLLKTPEDRLGSSIFGEYQAFDSVEDAAREVEEVVNKNDTLFGVNLGRLTAIPYLKCEYPDE